MLFCRTVKRRERSASCFALRDVAKVYGMIKLAQDTDMAREAMYRALSENGNPELETLTALLDAIGLRLSVEVKKRAS